MANNRNKKPNNGPEVTRYTYDDVTDPRTPETGHTALLPDDQVATLPMDTGWVGALEIGHPLDSNQNVVVDMDWRVDPVLFWAGKRNRREVPVLPLQRNEVVTESRIAQIIARARGRAAQRSPETQAQQLGFDFSDLEKTFREQDKDRRVDFYIHDENWKNKLICGDSLHVMESLTHYEGFRGKVQMIYVDPPYGIKYDSNFQQRVDSPRNDNKDKADDILTIKAYRDAWSLGIHSYLSYLQERLYLCRELLSNSGSIFVQINVENLHLIRVLMDEVFGSINHYGTIAFSKTTGFTDQRLSSVYDCLVWYGKDTSQTKYRQLYQDKGIGLEGAGVYNKVELPSGERRSLTRAELENIDALPRDWRVFRLSDLSAQGEAKEPQPFEYEGKVYYPSANSHWKTTLAGLKRLTEKRRIHVSGKSLAYVRFYDDFPVSPISNIWLDVGTGSFTDPKIYAVQTATKVVLRCINMTTDPADLVLDLTCGSGTTAYCAEFLGRRWITCDTSRVAINVARKRLLSAAYSHYKTRSGNVSSKFVYKLVNHVTLKSLAYDLEPEKVELINQPEIDTSIIRITGPFEVMTLGRYSAQDWKGYVTESGKLENYISVICRLYRPNAEIQAGSGFVHAVSDVEGEGRLAVSVGPLSGRVTASQINNAFQDALSLGIRELHVLGWAFEANVGEITTRLQSRGAVHIHLIMIRPDTLAEGLKITNPSQLFSPLALPDVILNTASDGQYTVTLNGVGIFDRKTRTTRYQHADSGYIAAWYLDQDYDGDCFVDSQMFFDFGKTPNIKTALEADIEPDDFKLQLTSEPFATGQYKRIAVKVVDVYGNESTYVKELA